MEPETKTCVSPAVYFPATANTRNPALPGRLSATQVAQLAPSVALRLAMTVRAQVKRLSGLIFSNEVLLYTLSRAVSRELAGLRSG